MGLRRKNESNAVESNECHRPGIGVMYALWRPWYARTPGRSGEAVPLYFSGCFQSLL